ncbi:MAG TPA: EAL domain-containing protein [Noviherbaspirillum sp.]|uniref:sensor domain-containing protein n=1 Tax=Noviherbaspirillum sp. TaxID=1926288 RepID=UPI002D28E813|nr:EAL domain-containing protein [Noviherbaspirillum sp.]HYD94377.1 EAL domain-containing protein [Noviherbaspirillum sp.]
MERDASAGLVDKADAGDVRPAGCAVTNAAACPGEEKYRHILEIIDDAYYEIDLRGHIVLCNGAFCRLLGYARDELIGRNSRDFQRPEAAARTYQLFQQLYYAGLAANHFDWELIRKDGSTIVGEGSVQLVRKPDGTASGFCGILRDVTARRKVEQALRDSEARYRSIIESIQDPFYEVDLQGNMVLFNGAFCRMLGYDRSEIIGRNNRELQPPEIHGRTFEVFNEVYRTGIPAESFDWQMQRKDGAIVTGEGSVQLVRNIKGEPVGFCGIMRDVTKRRRVEQALRESEARFRALTNLTSDWYWEQDADICFTRMESRDANAASVRHFFVGRKPWETGLRADLDRGWDAFRDLVQARKPFRDVVFHRTLDTGDPYYVSVSGEPIFDAAGTFTGYRGVAREITDKKVAESRIQYLATHDGLTGLPNRVMFSQLLDSAAHSGKRYDRSFAVLFIDLDRFKFINDTLGHAAGDMLLQEVSARFKDALRASDMIARLGGDEFVALVQELHDEEQAVAVARKIIAAASRPVMLMGRECRVSASIGIAMYPRDGDDEQTLMKHADIAMYHAKDEGKNNFKFYSKDIKTQSLERLTLETNLRRALERNEFTLHYQAKRDLASGAITGAEALLRWHNEEVGDVSPALFIPVAEEIGAIVPIGKWVLKTACEQNMAWQRTGLPPVCMAVNLSVRQFADEQLVDDIAAILRETGMPPQLLELEITEGMVVHDPDHAKSVLRAIKAMGVRLAIDDFGAGYSSLGQLKHFPIDTLKVDRSFIRDIMHSAGDKAITEAIISMGKTLQLTVVAEGVETPEQERFLRAHACDQMQGFLFSKPVPAAEFAVLLRAQSREAVK